VAASTTAQQIRSPSPTTTDPPTDPRTAHTVTYCLAMRLDEGLVFLADTRTNAGIDNVGSYRKLHLFQPTPDRLFVLESAGNLATTQQVIDRINQDLAGPGDVESLASVSHLFEAALYVGRLSREVADQHRQALNMVGADVTATFILGGQVGTHDPDILLVYPEGNYIRASEERPFLQIGESKYGKFMLELAAKAHVDLMSATKIGLGSMMSTAQANLSVGPPYDVGIYRAGSMHLEEFRFEADSPLLAKLKALWDRHLLAGVAELPNISRADLEEHDNS
jgi:putative proteasome-type protease